MYLLHLGLTSIPWVVLFFLSFIGYFFYWVACSAELCCKKCLRPAKVTDGQKNSSIGLVLVTGTLAIAVCITGIVMIKKTARSFNKLNCLIANQLHEFNWGKLQDNG